MKQIRISTFETNSSSSHSLAYAPNKLVEEKLETYIKGNTLYIGNIFDSLYYGRSPFEILFTTIDKIRYAYACFAGDESRQKDLIKAIKKSYPQVDNISTQCIYYGSTSEEENQLIGTDSDYVTIWMRKYKITLEEFIMNPHYVVIVDGDEYCIWNDMKSLGIIDKSCDMLERSKANV